MAFCKNCGAQMEDGARFCPACGVFAEDVQETRQRVRETDSTSRFDSLDIADNKWLSIFCYFGILTMIFALIAKPDSKFVKYHANQGLNLVLLGFASMVVCVIPFLGWIAAGVAGVFSLVCIILGIINCVNGKAKELPIIGSIRIIR